MGPPCGNRKSLGALPDVKLVYVKGHQDKHRAYARLSFLAQLNVDADDMAGQYQRDHGRAHPYALMMPNTGVYMVYPDGTRTANYVQDIRSRSTGPALRLHIQQKYQFSDATMDSINWGAHGKAMRAMIRKRVHLAKLVHECLPTLHRLNKFDDGRRTCPRCSV